MPRTVATGGGVPGETKSEDVERTLVGFGVVVSGKEAGSFGGVLGRV